MDLRHIARLLQRAVSVRVRRDPTLFSQEILGEILGVVGYMVLRSHCHLQQLMLEQDEARHSRGVWSESVHLDEVLPKVMALQAHFAELIQMNASTSRLVELARQRKIENEKAKKTPAPRTRKPANRLAPKRKPSSAAANRFS